jgi:hypothetical protein
MLSFLQPGYLNKTRGFFVPASRRVRLCHQWYISKLKVVRR